jgi:hypothetical protein
MEDIVDGMGEDEITEESSKFFSFLFLVLRQTIMIIIQVVTPRVMENLN